MCAFLSSCQLTTKIVVVPSVCLKIGSSLVHPPIFPSIHPPNHPPVHLSTHLPIYPSIHHPSTHRLIC